MPLAPFTTLPAFQNVLSWEPWVYGYRGLQRLDGHLLDNETNHAVSALYDPFNLEEDVVSLIYNSLAFVEWSSKLSRTWPKQRKSADGNPPTPNDGLPEDYDVWKWIVQNFPMKPDSPEILLSAVVRLFGDYRRFRQDYQAPNIAWLNAALQSKRCRDIVSRFVILNKNLDCRKDSLLACFASPDAFLADVSPQDRTDAIRLLKALFCLINVAQDPRLILALLKVVLLLLLVLAHR